MAEDAAYALKKAMECNTAENFLVTIFGMMHEELPDTLEKLEEMSGKEITSKVIITLVTPLDVDGI